MFLLILNLNIHLYIFVFGIDSIVKWIPLNNWSDLDINMKCGTIYPTAVQMAVAGYSYMLEQIYMFRKRMCPKSKQ